MKRFYDMLSQPEGDDGHANIVQCKKALSPPVFLLYRHGAGQSGWNFTEALTILPRSANSAAAWACISKGAGQRQRGSADSKGQQGRYPLDQAG